MTGKEVASAVATVSEKMNRQERLELACVLTGDKTDDALHECVKMVVIRHMRRRAQEKRVPDLMDEIFPRFR